jgi:hypothetical protein
MKKKKKKKAKKNNCRSKKFKIWTSVPKGGRHQDEPADCPSVAMQLELDINQENF